METQKHARRPMDPLTPAAKAGRDETDLLFADELEIQCAARRSATPQKDTDEHRRGSKVPSKTARDLAVGPIELIPILPIDEENARSFPVETTLLSPSPRQVVAPNLEKLQRSTLPDRQDVYRAAPLMTRPRRRLPLARAGVMAVIAGFAIGWLAGGPRGQSVSLTGGDTALQADTVLPAPVGGGTLGTAGLRTADEKPPAPAPSEDASGPDVRTALAPAASVAARAGGEFDAPATRAPSMPLRDAVPPAARLETPPPAPAPVPLREIPVPSASRELAAEKPAPPTAVPTPPPTVPIAEPAAITSSASTPSGEAASPKSAPAVEPVNETAAVRVALAKYASAYSDLDAAAVAAVWPSVDRAGLRKAFSALDAQQVTFDHCDVQVSGAAGRATCVGSAMWRPKIGGGNAREQNRTWTFLLKNAGGSWQIVKSDAR